MNNNFQFYKVVYEKDKNWVFILTRPTLYIEGK